MKLNRRNVLQLLGLAGASYAGASLLGSGPVRAGNPAVPKRLVFFYTEHGALKQFNDDGTLKQLWTPNVVGAPDARTIQTPWSTTDFTLLDVHQPLVARQKQILMLDGLDMISAGLDPLAPANAHYGGETHTLVAANRLSSTLPGGVSIDQLIAQSLNTPSPITVLPSLEAYIDQWGHDSPSYITAFTTAPGQPIALSGNASTIYDRMFPSGTQGTTDAEKAKQKKLLDQQTSVLEAGYERFKSVSGRTGSLDRARLDAHGQALRDLEKRLQLASVSTCVAPDKAITAGEKKAGDAASYAANADIMMRLIQTSLACDLTRVATLYAPQPPDGSFGYKSVGGTTDAHDMVHKTNGIKPALADDPDAMGIMKAYQTYHAKLFADFLDLLAAIPESDGTTLLDNTLVVWCGQIAAGDHSLDHVPYILAGNLGGQVKTGRYVRYPRLKTKDHWPTYSTGPAHNDLFVSLANMMDVPITTFGNPAACTGPLPGLAG